MINLIRYLVVILLAYFTFTTNVLAFNFSNAQFPSSTKGLVATVTLPRTDKWYSNVNITIENKNPKGVAPIDLQDSKVQFNSQYNIQNVWGDFDGSGISYPSVTTNTMQEITTIKLHFSGNAKLTSGSKFILQFVVNTPQGKAAQAGDFRNIKITTQSATHKLTVTLGDQRYPNSVIAGSVATVAQSYKVSNTGAVKVSVLKTTVTDKAGNLGHFTVSKNACANKALMPGDSCVFVVQYQVPSSVLQQHTDKANLTVVDDRQDKPMVKPQPSIVVKPNSTPTEHKLTVTLGDQHYPNSVIAGSVATVAQSYKVSNMGTVKVNVLKPIVTDGKGNLGHFTVSKNACANKALMPGASCMFVVQYQVPSSVLQQHTDRANLTVVDDQQDKPVVKPQPSIVVKPNVTPSASSGTLYYHAYLPITSVNDFAQGNSMNLTGGNYDDLILSNYIAGAMLSHLIDEKYPLLKGKYDRDYVDGMILGQLLQENLSTELYKSSLDVIDPSPKQAAVMGTGQGGPYQINSYAYDQIQSGHNALVNFVTLQKNIGYTVAEGANQASKETPASFNNKYYSPMLTAYFHLNDLLINIPSSLSQCLQKIGASANTNNPLDVLLSYSYNQGPWGSLLSSMVSDCLNMSNDAFLKKYNNDQNATGDTYHQYPYQVRYYLDELYDRSTISATPKNPAVHLIFKLSKLKTVFVNVFHKLAYLKDPSDIHSSENYQYIPETMAAAAFDEALSENMFSTGDTLDISNNEDRNRMFTVLATAINNLEQNSHANFLQAESVQIGEKLPLCPPNPEIYPAGIGNYKGGTIVEAKDHQLYQCKSDQLSTWCNQKVYAPAGAYSNSAWSIYQCRKH